MFLRKVFKILYQGFLLPLLFVVIGRLLLSFEDSGFRAFPMIPYLFAVHLF